MPDKVLKLLLELLDPSSLVPEDAVYVEINERAAQRVMELQTVLRRERLTESCFSASAAVFRRTDLAEALDIDPDAWEGKLCDQPYIELPDDLVLPSELDLARLELAELCVRDKFACWKLYVRDVEHVLETRELPLTVLSDFLAGTNPTTTAQQ